ncbi:MAG: ABC transporter ATP-binding protein [Saccharofermentans sp.]|nr:ABC transporter ATP-binding protein [Saccharofermentans sp.]
MEYMLETKGIVKKYGKRVVLNGINVKVPKGAVYGLIGPNGAGKTTLMRVVSGLSAPSSGSYVINGISSTDKKSSKADTGFSAIIEKPAFYEGVSVYSNMVAQCDIKGVKNYDCIMDLLKLVRLDRETTTKARNLSLGMKQRLGIAMALVGDAELVILDEPMNGLDPEGIIDIRNLILKLNKERGITFIISSHILDELSRVASVYGFIRNGNLVKEIDQQQLHEQGSVYTSISTDNNSLLITILDKKNLKYSIEDNDTVYVYAELSAEEIMPELSSNNIKLKSISTNTESLESIYLNIMKGENA